MATIEPIPDSCFLIDTMMAASRLVQEKRFGELTDQHLRHLIIYDKRGAENAWNNVRRLGPPPRQRNQSLNRIPRAQPSRPPRSASTRRYSSRRLNRYRH
jgi:hypothetical protein